MNPIVIFIPPIISILLIIYAKMKKADHLMGFISFWGIIISVLTFITEYTLSTLKF